MTGRNLDESIQYVYGALSQLSEAKIRLSAIAAELDLAKDRAIKNAQKYRWLKRAGWGAAGVALVAVVFAVYVGFSYINYSKMTRISGQSIPRGKFSYDSRGPNPINGRAGECVPGPVSRLGIGT